MPKKGNNILDSYARERAQSHGSQTLPDCEPRGYVHFFRP